MNRNCSRARQVRVKLKIYIRMTLSKNRSPVRNVSGEETGKINKNCCVLPQERFRLKPEAGEPF